LFIDVKSAVMAEISLFVTAAFNSATVALHRCGLRPTMTTRHPSTSSLRATALPMPSVAPVMSAI
jgi:hypothetical protein